MWLEILDLIHLSMVAPNHDLSYVYVSVANAATSIEVNFVLRRSLDFPYLAITKQHIFFVHLGVYWSIAYKIFAHEKYKTRWRFCIFSERKQHIIINALKKHYINLDTGD